MDVGQGFAGHLPGIIHAIHAPGKPAPAFRARRCSRVWTPVKPIAVRTSRHGLEWFEQFHKALNDIPEALEFYRLAGGIDYLIKAVVPDIAAYDALYKQLISKVELTEVTSMFAMEELKNTTEIPLTYAPRR